MSISLDSGDLLTDIEHHFRVTAGPGAGKTHWLVKHIQHVARSSSRLTPCSRIGVISYTNVAVREIIRRLDTAADAVDASTIHSFLYRNLVRPYIHLLKDEAGNDLVAHHLIDTHGEHYPSRTYLDQWLTARNRRQLLATARLRQFERLTQQMRSLTVRIHDDQQAYYVPRKTEARDRAIQDLLTPESLLDYKRRYWQAGTIDHEDVLYFAHRLLNENPMLRRFLSMRFPYLFIDEFQDTLPVQASVVGWLAEQETVVGVVGDPEQAIFGFLDASACHFRGFYLGGHRDYTIAGNRRSTGSIVQFLNGVRTDGLCQSAIRSDTGVSPVIYSGDLAGALAHARVTADASQMLVLARTHKGVLSVRFAGGGAQADPWEKLEQADPDRCRLLKHVLAAVVLSQQRLFDTAIQRLVQGVSTRDHFRKPMNYKGTVTVEVRRSLALSLLEHVLSRHDALLGLTALDLYDTLQQRIPTYLDGLTLPAVKAGKFRTAAGVCTYQSLIGAVQTTDDTRLIRTVHQAKGAEAPAVFLVLDQEQEDHILRPVADDEEQRITYVALSRAKDNLFAFCPSPKRLVEFAALGLTTHDLGASQFELHLG
jgi:DNA helicase-2/ATP-dependent DNA helicase PcrA